MSGSSGRRTSAGLLVYRWEDDVLEVLLVHPGGPFWARKDLGAWSIPKGELDAHEDPLATARREFVEELGTTPPDGPGAALGEVTQAAGKRVSAWAFEWPTARVFDPASIRSNDVEMEWPPRSGRRQRFPEVDRAEWFDVGTAAAKINPAQGEFLRRLVALLDG